MGFLDDLPKRDSTHDTAQVAESTFQAAIDASRLFVVQQKDRNDYGTDVQIEARDGQEMTNLRVHVQLKGTEAAPNADGSVSVGDISRTNLNYLLAQSDSIYACFHIPSGRLLARYAIDVFLDYDRHKSSWRGQDTITVRFTQEFDEAFQRTLHARVLSSGRSARNRRLEWTVTPPKKIPSLARRSIPPVEVPTNAAEAKKVLIELYHAGQDKVISASFLRFAAVLSAVPGGLDVAYMAEINLGINDQPFDELRVREGIQALQVAMGRGEMHPASLLYCQGNGWLALREYAKAKDQFLAALAGMEGSQFTDIAAQCCKNLGSTLQILGDSKAATQCLERALQLNPDLAEAHYALAVQLLQTGNDLKEARAHLDAIIHCDTSATIAPAVQGWRAEILFRMGDSAAAFRELNNVLASANQFNWVWPSCARQVAVFGRATTDSTIKALAFWRVYLREYPHDIAAQRQQFLCLAALHSVGRPTDADFDAFKQAAVTLIEGGDPDAAFLWDRVGHWAQDEGDWQNAERAFRRAYDLEPALWLLPWDRFELSRPACRSTPDALGAGR
jgi:tetratricopeptide (TPR) repeat protein